MRILLIASIVLTVVACGADKATAPLNLTGKWQYADNISNSELLTTCASNVTFDITQTGAGFTGKVSSGSETCTSQTAGTSVVSLVGAVINGSEISNTSVSFTSGTCSWSGTGSGDPVNHLEGQETCTLTISGLQHVFNGSWNAVR